MKARVDQLAIELEKKIIRAPFDGVVITRHVDRGEWISEGETVAVIGKDDVIDLVAQLPEQFIQYIKIGMPVKAAANGQDFSGTVIASFLGKQAVVQWLAWIVNRNRMIVGTLD